MKEQGELNNNNNNSDNYNYNNNNNNNNNRGEEDGETGRRVMPRHLTAEELHVQELESRKKLFEKNYTSYEEYVEKELGIDINDGDEEEVGDDMNLNEREDEGTKDIGEEDKFYADECMSLPEFMIKKDQTIDANSKKFTRRRDILQAPEELMNKIFITLGEPHGDIILSHKDPLHWNTEEIFLWLTKMEAARSFLLLSSSSSTTTSNNNNNREVIRDTLLMEDPCMQEAFRISHTYGNFLLHHIFPSTLFQLMRRWHLRRQEIALTIMKELKQQNSNSNNNEFFIMGHDEAVIQTAVRNGKMKLDEVVLKITPDIIQETICQCYPYCH